MANKGDRMQCIHCGRQMVYETRADSVEYRGRSKTFETDAWWCESCGEGILDGPALQKSEQVFLALKAEVDGVLSPNKVAMVRKKLGISQKKASELLGGGPRSFQKYESGETAVSIPMSNLLRLLDNDPKRLDELKPATSALARQKGGSSRVGENRKAHQSAKASAGNQKSRSKSAAPRRKSVARG